MSVIQNKKYLKEMIIDNNRHQFIYGRNNKEREEFIKSIIEENPVVCDKKSPVGIYIPNINIQSAEKPEDLNQQVLNVFNAEIFTLLLSLSIINSIISSEINITNENLKSFLKATNIFLNYKGSLNKLEELKTSLSETMEIYSLEYLKYIQGKPISNFFNKLPISRIELNHFIQLIKELLNNKSYFAMFFDMKTPFSIPAMKMNK